MEDKRRAPNFRIRFLRTLASYIYIITLFSKNIAQVRYTRYAYTVTVEPDEKYVDVRKVFFQSVRVDYSSVNDLTKKK